MVYMNWYSSDERNAGFRAASSDWLSPSKREKPNCSDLVLSSVTPNHLDFSASLGFEAPFSIPRDGSIIAAAPAGLCLYDHCAAKTSDMFGLAERQSSAKLPENLIASPYAGTTLMICPVKANAADFSASLDLVLHYSVSPDGSIVAAAPAGLRLDDHWAAKPSDMFGFSDLHSGTLLHETRITSPSFGTLTISPVTANQVDFSTNFTGLRIGDLWTAQPTDTFWRVKRQEDAVLPGYWGGVPTAASLTINPMTANRVDFSTRLSLVPPYSVSPDGSIVAAAPAGFRLGDHWAAKPSDMFGFSELRGGIMPHETRFTSPSFGTLTISPVTVNQVDFSTNFTGLRIGDLRTAQATDVFGRVKRQEDAVLPGCWSEVPTAASLTINPVMANRVDFSTRLSLVPPYSVLPDGSIVAAAPAGLRLDDHWAAKPSDMFGLAERQSGPVPPVFKGSAPKKRPSLTNPNHDGISVSLNSPATRGDIQKLRLHTDEIEVRGQISGIEAILFTCALEIFFPLIQSMLPGYSTIEFIFLRASINFAFLTYCVWKAKKRST